MEHIKEQMNLMKKTIFYQYKKQYAAIKWAQDNGYEYIEINDDWFKFNYNEVLTIGQPDEEKLKRLLSQFK
jgi:hypothetical protein